MVCIEKHVCTHTHICTMKYYSAIKKNEIMPCAAPWMNLEIIILSEVRERMTNIIRYHLYAESKNELICQTETDS